MQSNTSDAAVDKVGMDVRVKVGDSKDKRWPNYSTFWLTVPVLRTFVQYLIAFDRKQLVASFPKLTPTDASATVHQPLTSAVSSNDDID